MSKRKLKRLIKTIVKIHILFLIALVMIAMANVAFLETSDVAFRGFLYVAVAIIMAVPAAIAIVVLIYFVENLGTSKKTEYLERDIPKEIPPAIASILLDFYVDDEQDYLSTVSSLISRGYIEIVNNQEIIIKNNNLDGLLEHEILAFEIVSKKRFYNSEEFKKKTIQDAKKLGLLERANRFAMMWDSITDCIVDTVVLMIIAGVGAAMPYTLEDYGITSSIPWIVFWILCIVFAYKIFKDAYLAYSYNSPSREQSLKYIYNKTEKGDKYAERISSLRKFLNEYTLMNEKDLESIKIYEDYIPYAIALGESDAIDKFIEKDNNCRRLIYRV